MANIIVQGKEYNNVPAVRLPAVGGGSATFYESGGGGVIAQPITITENGVYTAPEDTAYTPVTVQVSSPTPTLQSKTVNPTTSQQTVSPDYGYDGLSSVTVNAMPIGSATTPYTEIVENPVISVNGNGLIEAVVQHRESVTPTVVAGYVASGTAGDVDVDGYSTHQLSTQAGTTIAPTESQQTAVASGKYTTGAVLVGAISSSYVGSGITRRDSTDLSASGDTVTVPSGYYANSSSKAVSSGSATTPATTISPSVNISVSNSGLITATAQDYEDITPTVVAGYVSSGTSGRVDVDAYDTYQLPTQSATTITPSTVSQTAVTAGKYTTGAITVDPIPSQYIVPTGTISITNNGTVDVTQYASADVSIPATSTSYLGTNPVKIADYATQTVALSSTSFATWTPSTTYTTIYASSNVGTAVLDMVNYNYNIVWFFDIEYKYDGTESSASKALRTCQSLQQAIYKSPSTTANLQSQKYNGNYCSTLFTAGLISYYNASSAQKLTYTSSVVAYLNATAATFSSSSSNTPTLTVKTPSIRFVCNNTYLSTANCAKIDKANTKFTLRGELWRVDKDSVMQGMYRNIVELYNS